MSSMLICFRRRKMAFFNQIVIVHLSVAYFIHCFWKKNIRYKFAFQSVCKKTVFFDKINLYGLNFHGETEFSIILAFFFATTLIRGQNECCFWFVFLHPNCWQQFVWSAMNLNIAENKKKTQKKCQKTNSVRYRFYSRSKLIFRACAERCNISLFCCVLSFSSV